MNLLGIHGHIYSDKGRGDSYKDDLFKKGGANPQKI